MNATINADSTLFDIVTAEIGIGTQTPGVEAEIRRLVSKAADILIAQDGFTPLSLNQRVILDKAAQMAEAIAYFALPEDRDLYNTVHDLLVIA
ncbi:hypothetical protein [Nocardia pseudovaccinii]|uniref:hypothetical protein n=1 Tax=Nocardia pseudovaccinii TaxID=189540 RepID=UPI0007A3BA88|nr:hypothetical protein [Nocardia pseudovaccinii]